MATRISHSDEPALYFCTFTCYRWLDMFEQADGYDLVYKWFSYLRSEKKIETTAYVIMPNHIHCILHFPETGYSLNKIISNAKRFMAYGIIDKLTKLNNQEMLSIMTAGVTVKEAAKGQKHRVFENTFDAKAIYTEEFFFQKLDYIHFNPVKGKWNLAEDYREYPHSSASFYELTKPGEFVPKHFRDL